MLTTVANVPLIVVSSLAAIIVVALVALWLYTKGKLNEFKQKHQSAQSIVDQAKRDADQIKKESELEARDWLLKSKDSFQRETEGTRNELKELERRLSKREDSVTEQSELLLRKEKTIESIERRLSDREQQLQENEQKVQQALGEQAQKLQELSGLSQEQARELFITRISQEMEHEEGEIIRHHVDRANEEGEERARNIIVQSIQRMASDITSEATVSSVDIPSDEMKGRVIGREGRNIRAFEKATGVDVIVDDTPGVVIVSGHDSVRREIGRRAMSKLIVDGRIHPARIEEVVAETRKEVDQQILEGGKQVVHDLKIRGLNNKLIPLLGRLQFRTSYGQNVLQHAVEVAHLSGMIAEELGLDSQLATRCGLLHDVGKAVDHEVEGGHPEIGGDLCRRYGEPPEVVDAASAHHDLKPTTNIYSWIVSAADAVSASRPGARRESLERYLQRLEKLESIAMAFREQGVESAFAIQAGREIRVMVDANRSTDTETMKLARDIALKIESELTFPGEIQVTVLREKRAVEYARYVS